MFAEASCNPTSVNSSGAYEMHPLPFNFLASAVKPFCSCSVILESVFEEKTGERSPSNITLTDSAAIAVLASFYILYREKCKRNQGTSLANCSYDSSGTDNEGVSWSNLLRFLPLDKLLAHMESCLNSYEHIYARVSCPIH